MDLPLEIWEIILDYSDFLSKIRLIQLSKFHKNNLYISDFYNIKSKYLNILDSNILNSNPKIKYSNLIGNIYIQDLNILTGLKKLYLPSHQKNQLTNYNLEEIHGLFNFNIINFNKFTNLKYLKIFPDGPILPDLNNLTKLQILDILGSNLDLSGYKYLNLTELSAQGDIREISHLTNLKILNLCSNNNIINSDMRNFDLSELRIFSCCNITIINHFTNLTILEYSNTYIDLDLSGLNLNKLKLNNGIKPNQITKYNGFSHMTNLTDLTFDYYKINLNNFKKLKKLYCIAPICDSDISEINPIDLTISNTNISDISHITNLKYLNCQNNSEITKINNPNLQILKLENTNISNLNLPKLKKLILVSNLNLKNIYAENLTKLHLENTPELTNLDDFINLEKLNLYGKSAITILKNLKLKNLDLGNQINISDLNYLTNLKILVAFNLNLYNTSIQKLNLRTLDIFNNPNITDINFLTGLKNLYCGGTNSSISYSSIQKLNLEFLDMSFNQNIPDLNFLTSLKILVPRIIPKYLIPVSKN